MSTTFGEELQRRRNLKGYSLRQLAARTNGACTFGYINQIENARSGKTGIFQVDVEIVDALAKALDWDIDEARLAAGYAPSRHIELHGHKIVLPDDVSVLFPDTNLIKSKEDAQRFEASFRAMYEVVKAQILAERGDDQ